MYIGILTSIALSFTFVLNLKLERLCLVKKILKDCESSTSPKEFPSTHSTIATIFHIRHSMTSQEDIEEGCTDKGGKGSIHGNDKNPQGLVHTEERLRLSGAENTGRGTGWLMLNINELNNFHYQPELHDMRCKALNYLQSFWTQIFTYKNDREYSIYNLPAERMLNPVTVLQNMQIIIVNFMDFF